MNNLYNATVGIDAAIVSMYPFTKSGQVSKEDKEQLYMLWKNYSQVRNTYEEMCLTGNTSMFELVSSNYQRTRDELLKVLNVLAVRYQS